MCGSTPRHLGEAFLKEHFPTIHARCLKLGIDIARQPIPVVPAAHYTCGGVVTDLERPHRPAGPVRRGRDHLHRAARRQPAGQQLAARMRGARPHLRRGTSCGRRRRRAPALPAWDESQVENADEQVVIAHNWDELRLLMWNYVGIVRTTKRLERALHRIELLKSEIDEYYANFRVTRDLLELRNLVDCAELIVRSALMRHESRGLHFSRDFPRTLPVSFPTVLIRDLERDQCAAEAPAMLGTKPRRGCAIAGRVGRDEGQHAIDAAQRLRARSARAPGSRRCRSPGKRSRPAAAFIAIHGQCAQLLHVALLPAVGASISVLPGASCCMRWNMPLSVATMYSLAVPSTTALNSCEVEPTTIGLRDHRSAATRDAPAPSRPGAPCAAVPAPAPLNSSWTMQAPFHISMSAPVCSWM